MNVNHYPALSLCHMTFDLYRQADATRDLYLKPSWPGLPPVSASHLTKGNKLLGATRPCGSLTASLGDGGGHGDGNDNGNRPPAIPRNASPDSLQIEVIGQPSLRVYEKAGSGNLVISIRRLSNFMGDITEGDLSEMRMVGEQIFRQLKAMSRGAYTSRDLARLGHPYGFDYSTKKGKEPRKLPRRFNGKSIGHVAGVRGSVPSLSVTNLQSGKLEASWRWSLLRDADGISINLWSDAKSKDGFGYPFALAGGTGIMRAHGPFTHAPTMFLPEIDAKWRHMNLQAYHRQQAMNQIGLGMAA